jgi:phosphoadenosine phosphosulfate reductase
MSADTLISPMPIYGPAESLAEHREALARRAAWRLEDASPQTIIRWAVRTFGGRFAITSSMADAVLIDLVAKAAPGTDVVFLDTGYHFEETLTMRDAVAATYRGRINLVNVTPEQTVAEQDAEHGRDLFGVNPDRCCFLRKVVPLDRALAGYDAWGSGLRRDDSIARSRTPVVDWDRRNGKVKVNPLARWTQADVDTYVKAHDILTNPLLDAGFASVGCFPCTRRVGAGDEVRSGRWAGSTKNECGIHLVEAPA